MSSGVISMTKLQVSLAERKSRVHQQVNQAKSQIALIFLPHHSVAVVIVVAVMAA